MPFARPHRYVPWHRLLTAALILNVIVIIVVVRDAAPAAAVAVGVQRFAIIVVQGRVPLRHACEVLVVRGHLLVVLRVLQLYMLVQRALRPV